MTISERLKVRKWTRSDLLGGVLLVTGIGLAGVGGYFHFTIAAQVRAGQCDGCEPWHPLIVLAPLVVGSVFLLLAGDLLARR
jgi:hypothetical protein